jgi:hypothetical protein
MILELESLSLVIPANDQDIMATHNLITPTGHRNIASSINLCSFQALVASETKDHRLLIERQPP